MPTPEQLEALKRFFIDWRQAQVNVAAMEARFKGAAEFAFGSAAVTFNYDTATDELTFTEDGK